MNANGQLIETLKNSPMYEGYQRAFTEATGLPITLRPAVTWQLPLHGVRGENGFCAMTAEKSKTCSACLHLQEKLAESAKDEACTMTCPYGLSETAVPVKLGQETIGFLQTGQVMKSKPTQAGFRRAVEEAGKLGVDIDNERARAAFMDTAVLPQRKIESVTELLKIFADHLSMKSNQIAVQTANAEPPVITRAKQYIEEHHAEDISLGEVAKSVHTSLYYFCKIFKKHTGIHFTEYVSRVRVEKAKNLLLNPNLRISEIAYEVGFQSLTHFNRVFKKIVRQSPTEFRGRLFAGA